MSTADQPLRLRWVKTNSGRGVFVAAQPAVQERLEAELAAGEVYEFLRVKPRSLASMIEYQKCVKKAFENLPERWASQYDNPTHLRKKCLIALGYRTIREIPQTDAETAQRALTNFKPGDKYAMMEADGPILRILTARSQSDRGSNPMTREEFEASKRAVLETLADMIGVDYETLLSWGGHET